MKLQDFFRRYSRRGAAGNDPTPVWVCGDATCSSAPSAVRITACSQVHCRLRFRALLLRYNRISRRDQNSQTGVCSAPGRNRNRATNLNQRRNSTECCFFFIRMKKNKSSLRLYKKKTVSNIYFLFSVWPKTRFSSFILHKSFQLIVRFCIFLMKLGPYRNKLICQGHNWKNKSLWPHGIITASCSRNLRSILWYLAKNNPES